MATSNCSECRDFPGRPERIKHAGASHCTDCLRHFFVSQSPTGTGVSPGCESPVLPGYCRQCVREMPWALYTALRAALGNPEPSAGARPLSSYAKALELAVARPGTPGAADLARKMDDLHPSLAEMMARAFERLDAERDA